MDQEVAKTLGELELKLQELERELTSIGRRDTPSKAGQAPSEPQTPSKLIDEAVERDGRGGPDSYQSDEQERSVDNAFGGPAVFGGEEVPAQGTTISSESAFPVSETAYGEIATGSIATGSPQSAPSFPPNTPSFPPPTPSFPSGVFAPLPPHTSEPGPPLPPPGPPIHPPGPPLPTPTHAPQPSASLRGAPPAPTPPPPPSPVDRAELVRFKEKMQRTMEDLIDEYGKLLLPKPPA